MSKDEATMQGRVQAGLASPQERRVMQLITRLRCTLESLSEERELLTVVMRIPRWYEPGGKPLHTNVCMCTSCLSKHHRAHLGGPWPGSQSMDDFKDQVGQFVRDVKSTAEIRQQLDCDDGKEVAAPEAWRIRQGDRVAVTWDDQGRTSAGKVYRVERWEDGNSVWHTDVTFGIDTWEDGVREQHTADINAVREARFWQPDGKVMVFGRRKPHESGGAIYDKARMDRGDRPPTPEEQQERFNAELAQRRKELTEQQAALVQQFGEAGWRSPFWIGQPGYLEGVGYRGSSVAYGRWKNARDKFAQTNDPADKEAMLSFVGFSNPPEVHEVPVFAAAKPPKRWPAMFLNMPILAKFAAVIIVALVALTVLGGILTALGGQ